MTRMQQRAGGKWRTACIAGVYGVVVCGPTEHPPVCKLNTFAVGDSIWAEFDSIQQHVAMRIVDSHPITSVGQHNAADSDGRQQSDRQSHPEPFH
jgi:hypothetical protein